MVLVNNILFSFGYENIRDFWETMYFKSTLGIMFLVSLSMSGAEYMMEEFLGLQPIAYFAILVLFILEFLTGVSASIFVKKEKFNSWKCGRMVIKIFVYSTILAIFHILSQTIGGVNIFKDFDLNFFEWTYSIVLNLLILQLLISVLENVQILGFKEVSILLKVFNLKKRQIEEKIKADDK